MKTTIGDFDKTTGTVSVTFEDKGVTHSRNVNACVDAKGKFDKAATEARVAEVALGVAHKITVGAIVNPPPVPEDVPITNAPDKA